MLGSPDTCGWTPNPQRKNCGFKNSTDICGRALVSSTDICENDSFWVAFANVFLSMCILNQVKVYCNYIIIMTLYLI